MPSLLYLMYQFVPAHCRNKNPSYFKLRVNVMKKIQTKTKQNNNLDIQYANVIAKNACKVLVAKFDEKHTMMLSCDDKHIVKIESLGNPLALCLKTKPG